MRSDANDALAGLRSSYLERDDESDPEGRIYRDKATGEIFHSVTRILGATAPEAQQKALESWLKSPGAAQTSQMASTRGTAMHNAVEYQLKTASRLARATANKRGVWRCGDDGLYRAPSKIVQWGLEKAIAGAPPVGWSAAGYARSLRGWVLDHITAIHAVEFFGHHPAGFAGAADGLLDIDGKGPYICDWKSTSKSIHKSMDAILVGYKAQAGAYSLMLQHLTGIKPIGGAIVVARRTGAPQAYIIEGEELEEQEQIFLERCSSYFDDLHERLKAA